MKCSDELDALVLPVVPVAPDVAPSRCTHPVTVICFAALCEDDRCEEPDVWSDVCAAAPRATLHATTIKPLQNCVLMLTSKKFLVIRVAALQLRRQRQTVGVSAGVVLTSATSVA